VGNSAFRVGTDTPKEVDTVPFGCYKREVFEKYGYYDERLERNQDIELNKRILSGGGKIYLVPDVTCTYYARESLKALAKNNYANGRWNILTAYYTGTLRSLSFRHFVPLLFVLSLILPLIGGIFYPKLLYIALLSSVGYIALAIIYGIRINDSGTNLFALLLTFTILHISYGMGSLVGLFEIVQNILKGYT
jgi:GT2 family glycosyltransferase